MAGREGLPASCSFYIDSTRAPAKTLHLQIPRPLLALKTAGSYRLPQESRAGCEAWLDEVRKGDLERSLEEAHPHAPHLDHVDVPRRERLVRQLRNSGTRLGEDVEPERSPRWCEPRLQAMEQSR